MNRPAVHPPLARPGALAVLIACACALSTSVASAQDAQQAASARALFDQGTQFADAGNWVDAEDRFRRALALKDSPIITYNHAGALEELGRLVEASEQLRKVARSEGAPRDLVREAGQQADAISARLAQLTVTPSGDTTGASIAVDDKPLAEAMFGVPIPADPGSRTVVATRAGSEVDRQTVVLEEGGAAEILIQVGEAAPSPAAVAAAAPVAPDSVVTADEDSDGSGVWLWAGAGVVTVGVIVLVAVLASGGGDDPGMETPHMGDFGPGAIGVEVAP